MLAGKAAGHIINPGLEFENYQTHLSNLMMMSTLIFGFSVTGTFLSLSFSGDEPFSHQTDLIAFVKYSLWAAVLAIVATMVAFVTSSRLAHLHINFGSLHAVKRAGIKTYFIIGLAEVLLFCSLYLFMQCLQSYKRLNFLGPPICPYYKYGRVDEYRHDSICSQLGSELYQAAAKECGDPQPVTLYDRVIDEGNAGLSKCRAGRTGEPAVMCGAYDCYYRLKEEKEVIEDFWFGWSSHPRQLSLPNGTVQPVTFSTMSFFDMFGKIAQEAGEAYCLKDPTEARMDEACRDDDETTSPSRLNDCALARRT
eukprot:TRINITY_DN4264_c0_g1_i4.p1 TRINITY_DN4264_c0_g1~~TRINITY_DN4264_c0_g1_i4.p1  ORF type:complete len:309 (-),score=29.93 TRINITY_DN4264_c0_g1_i4:123-1049(-)